MTYLLPAIALLFWIGGYGLMRRTIWAWYLGLVYLFLVAGRSCYPLLYYILEGGPESAIPYAGALAVGGLSLWLCGLLWWIKRKHEFRSWY